MLTHRGRSSSLLRLQLVSIFVYISTSEIISPSFSSSSNVLNYANLLKSNNTSSLVTSGLSKSNNCTIKTHNHDTDSKRPRRRSRYLDYGSYKKEAEDYIFHHPSENHHLFSPSVASPINLRPVVRRSRSGNYHHSVVHHNHNGAVSYNRQRNSRGRLRQNRTSAVPLHRSYQRYRNRTQRARQRFYPENVQRIGVYDHGHNVYTSHSFTRPVQTNTARSDYGRAYDSSQNNYQYESSPQTVQPPQHHYPNYYDQQQQASLGQHHYSANEIADSYGYQPNKESPREHQYQTLPQTHQQNSQSYQEPHHEQQYQPREQEPSKPPQQSTFESSRVHGRSDHNQYRAGAARGSSSTPSSVTSPVRSNVTNHHHRSSHSNQTPASSDSQDSEDLRVGRSLNVFSRYGFLTLSIKVSKHLSKRKSKNLLRKISI